ncbi:hypothetical protein BDV59DRAFT_93607 [Aspergillus ambiguus]|uniref:uncharacterized protein n=1 Tax=Aspergillus ambiguus TaxID=176160 RepID=UPI003CCDC84D
MRKEGEWLMRKEGRLASDFLPFPLSSCLLLQLQLPFLLHHFDFFSRISTSTYSSSPPYAGNAVILLDSSHRWNSHPQYPDISLTSPTIIRLARRAFNVPPPSCCISPNRNNVT